MLISSRENMRRQKTEQQLDTELQEFHPANNGSGKNMPTPASASASVPFPHTTHNVRAEEGGRRPRAGDKISQKQNICSLTSYTKLHILENSSNCKGCQLTGMSFFKQYIKNVTQSVSRLLLLFSPFPSLPNFPTWEMVCIQRHRKKSIIFALGFSI